MKTSQSPQFTVEELKKIVTGAGIVGAGGAGFPLAFKLRDDLVDTLIINGAECEPLIYSDYYLMKKYLDDIVRGAQIIMKATNIKRCFLSVKEHTARSLRLTQGQTLGEGVTVHELPNVYPVGDEIILIYETTGRVVQPGCLPFTAGVIVSNVETVYNVKRAAEDKPVTSKWVTISGKVPKKIFVEVPIGMNVGELLSRFGIKVPEDCAVLDGGPAMGKLIDPSAAFIRKTTKSILILPEDTPAVISKTASTAHILKKASSVCCQCSMCSDLCTRALLGYPISPSRTVRAVAAFAVDNPQDYLSAQLCSGCGVCELMACCQGISPVTLMTEIKKTLGANHIRYSHTGPEVKALSDREYRMVPAERFKSRVGVLPFDQVPEDMGELDKAPSRLVIALSQHIGKPAEPVVKPGDRVTRGELIAKAAEGGPSAAIHASWEGVVESVDEGPGGKITIRCTEGVR